MEYRCRKCGLEFNHDEITAEDEQGRDLCPACCKPLNERDKANWIWKSFLKIYY